MVRIGFVQPRLGSKDTLRNIERCISLASGLNRPDLVVMPELSNTAYGFETRAELRELSEEIPDGVSTDLLAAASGEMDCVLVAGVAERDGPLLHDSAVVVEAGRYVGKYRKTHLYGPETLYFEPGRDCAKVYQLGKFRLAVQICLDLGFPDELGRLSTMGAQIVAHPANLSFAHSGPPQTIRARGNAAYIVSSNRVGEDSQYSRSVTFTGESMILSPTLEVMALASKEGEQATQIEADLAKCVPQPPAPPRGLT